MNDDESTDALGCGCVTGVVLGLVLGLVFSQHLSLVWPLVIR